MRPSRSAESFESVERIAVISATEAAALDCLEICAEEGWLPTPSQTLRLVGLRDEVARGRRSEHLVADGDLRRLEWLRWQVQHGYVNDL